MTTLSLSINGDLNVHGHINIGEIMYTAKNNTEHFVFEDNNHVVISVCEYENTLYICEQNAIYVYNPHLQDVRCIYKDTENNINCDAWCMICMKIADDKTALFWFGLGQNGITVIRYKDITDIDVRYCLYTSMSETRIDRPKTLYGTVETLNSIDDLTVTFMFTENEGDALLFVTPSFKSFDSVSTIILTRITDTDIINNVSAISYNRIANNTNGYTEYIISMDDTSSESITFTNVYSSPSDDFTIKEHTFTGGFNGSGFTYSQSSSDWPSLTHQYAGIMKVGEEDVDISLYTVEKNIIYVNIIDDNGNNLIQYTPNVTSSYKSSMTDINNKYLYILTDKECLIVNISKDGSNYNLNTIRRIACNDNESFIAITPDCITNNMALITTNKILITNDSITIPISTNYVLRDTLTVPKFIYNLIYKDNGAITYIDISSVKIEGTLSSSTIDALNARLNEIEQISQTTFTKHCNDPNAHHLAMTDKNVIREVIRNELYDFRKDYITIWEDEVFRNPDKWLTNNVSANGTTITYEVTGHRPNTYTITKEKNITRIIYPENEPFNINFYNHMIPVSFQRPNIDGTHTLSVTLPYPDKIGDTDNLTVKGKWYEESRLLIDTVIKDDEIIAFGAQHSPLFLSYDEYFNKVFYAFDTVKDANGNSIDPPKELYTDDTTSTDISERLKYARYVPILENDDIMVLLVHHYDNSYTLHVVLFNQNIYANQSSGYTLFNVTNISDINDPVFVEIRGSNDGRCSLRFYASYKEQDNNGNDYAPPIYMALYKRKWSTKETSIDWSIHETIKYIDIIKGYIMPLESKLIELKKALNIQT